MAYKMVAGLFDSIVSALVEQNRQEHERKMAEFEIIANSSERDNYARQLVLDRMLAPMEKAQREIQKAAQHAQWLSEKIEDYHKDHCMTIEQARDVERQLKLIAIRLTNITSRNDLMLIYDAITRYCLEISCFRHRYEKI